MKMSKSIMEAFLILSIIAGTFSLSHGNNKGVESPLLFEIGTLSIIALGLFDIGTAPFSAKRYNDNLMGMNPLDDKGGKSYSISNNYPFGQSTNSQTKQINRYILSIDDFSSKNIGDQRKHPDSALMWSLGATAIPIAAGVYAEDQGDDFLAFLLITSGVIVGPSAGHLYAEQYARGWITIGLRTGLSILLLALVSDW